MGVDRSLSSQQYRKAIYMKAIFGLLLICFILFLDQNLVSAKKNHYLIETDGKDPVAYRPKNQRCNGKPCYLPKLTPHSSKGKDYNDPPGGDYGIEISTKEI